MRTDPVTDSWAFLLGATSDQENLGPWRYLLVLVFWLLLIGSFAVAWANWRRDLDQRRAGMVWTWLLRLLIGIMWFQGSIWKLPFPVSGGLQYWTEQMAANAAFPFFGAIVREWMLPNMAAADPLVFIVEMGLAVSYMLGLFVRPVAVLGTLYVVGLWMGLYRHPNEWPWEYVFLIAVQLQFALQAAGNCLGLDALRRPRLAELEYGRY